MALSNVLVEPRRELTEQVVGLLVAVLPMGLIAWVVRWFTPMAVDGREPHLGDYAFVTFVVTSGGFIAFWVVVGVLLLIHAIGEVVCGALARAGLELRPKRRYRRNYAGQIVEV